MEPENEIESVFSDIFANILSLHRVGTTENFFELGGTPLMVTRVIIEADKQECHAIYGDFFCLNSPQEFNQGRVFCSNR